MSKDLIRARVRTLRHEAEGIISVELVPADGVPFPCFDPGAHIDVHLPNGLVRSYSLMNRPEDANRYLIGVLADPKSRGGSYYVHEKLRCGTVVPIGIPRNNFALEETAGYTILIAGGIGITPLLCMFRRLVDLGRNVELVYCVKTRAHAAFVDEIRSISSSCRFHFDDEHNGNPLDLHDYLAIHPRDVHAYCCGPGPMLRAFEDACKTVGIANVHIERFAAQPTASSSSNVTCVVRLARSGQTFEVPPDRSILDVLLDAGIDVDCSCKEGICGACETAVLEGIPDHRDSVLSPAERQENRMMICVSRVIQGPLVLDL